MTVVEALNLARAAGINFRIEGGDLVLEAVSPPPSDMLDLLRPHKAEILKLLRPVPDRWLRPFSRKGGADHFTPPTNIRALTVPRRMTSTPPRLSSASTCGT